MISESEMDDDEQEGPSSSKIRRVEKEDHLIIERRVDVYRKSNLGKSLAGALQELLNLKKIEAGLAEVVLQQFDRSVGRNLPHTRNHLVFSAERVNRYRLIADNWKVTLQNVTFSTPYSELVIYYWRTQDLKPDMLPTSVVGNNRTFNSKSSFILQIKYYLKCAGFNLLIMAEQEVDILEKVRIALDSGIVNLAKPAPDAGGDPDQNGASCGTTTKQPPGDYIDIDEYCKMLQDFRDDGIGPMDSRNLIGKQQTKLDSQQTSHSVADLHDRVSSFDILKWSQKPDCISSFQCARFGWKLTEWGFLACVTCKNILPVPSQIPKINGDWANRLRQGIESSGHLPTCPWVRMPSAEDILAVPKGSDLFKFLCESVGSFKMMKTVPTLENHYKMVSVDLSLKWLCELTSATLPDVAEEKEKGVTPEMVRNMALFLVLNGWSMSEVEDIMTCQLCLREVPLWLCQPTPPQHEILDLLSPPASPVLNKSFSYKEFNPVSNHWSWCPWRKRLLTNVDESLMSMTPTKDSQQEFIRIKNQPSVDDYEKLLEDFKKECASITLNYDKETSNVRLIDSVTSLFDNFIGSSVQPLSDGIEDSNDTNGGVDGNGLSKNHDNSEKECNSEKATEEDPADVVTPPKKRIRRELFEAGADI
ncbi:unnamed protein product [Allacma fusca]|uniref:Uncharacterized protein n=1 Tax=Allacma fusca TaxID=39272 RepID=A0A8J2NV31_9HEXA|nr:unnamed protein product [Allacma fusca]